MCLTNALSIAVIHALSSAPFVKKAVQFPCNTRKDFQLLVDLCNYRLEDESIFHTSFTGEAEAFFFFPSGSVIHFFAKEE